MRTPPVRYRRSAQSQSISRHVGAVLPVAGSSSSCAIGFERHNKNDLHTALNFDLSQQGMKRNRKINTSFDSEDIEHIIMINTELISGSKKHERSLFFEKNEWGGRLRSDLFQKKSLRCFLYSESMPYKKGKGGLGTKRSGGGA
jgi:hypothetical protein